MRLDVVSALAGLVCLGFTASALAHTVQGLRTSGLSPLNRLSDQIGFSRVGAEQSAMNRLRFGEASCKPVKPEA